MSWVLVTWVWTYGSNGGNAIAMHDFTTQERCESARVAIAESKEGKWIGAKGLCVLK